MDDWYDLGTHIKCYTCLGTEVSGVLTAYDIDQKLLLLQRRSKTTTGALSTTSTINKNSNTSSPRTKNEKTSSPVPPLGPAEQTLDPKDYILLNLKYVASIVEVVETDPGSFKKPRVNQVENATSSLPSTSASASPTTTNSSGLVEPTATTPDDSSESRNLAPLEEITPPAQLDMSKLKEKLKKNRLQKMEDAKIASQGVTRVGLDLYNYMKITLGTRDNSVKWDGKGSIVVFDDVKIPPPYTKEAATLIHDQANPQTLVHQQKLIHRFYMNREEKVNSLKSSRTVNTVATNKL